MLQHEDYQLISTSLFPLALQEFYDINICKYGHYMFLALNVKNIFRHPICWTKLDSSTRYFLQYAHLPLSTVPNHINLSPSHESIRFCRCSRNSSIFVGRSFIFFFKRTTEEAWVRCLMMILTKKYLKCGSLLNMLSQYLRRCFSYWWRWAFLLHGCHQYSYVVGNNVGNAVWNNLLVLYSLIDDEPMPSQLSSLVNPLFVSYSYTLGLFSQD